MNTTKRLTFTLAALLVLTGLAGQEAEQSRPTPESALIALRGLAEADLAAAERLRC